MSLALALALLPAYATFPGWRASMTGISTRFPFDGVSPSLPASGITGLAGTITPRRSAAEVAAWGADSVWWTYAELAPIRGFPSSAAYIAELRAAGATTVQVTTNTSSPSIALGPHAKDLAGTDWSAGSNPPRPTLASGSYPVGQEYQRVPITVTMMRWSDQAGTINPKLAIVAGQLSEGGASVQLDDPRGAVGSAGFRGPVLFYDLAPQGVDFSDTAIAAFAVWLGANTTVAERTALGLPSSTAGFDVKAWLVANYPASVNNGNQVVPSAIDQYLWRTGVSANAVQREVFLGLYNRYQRAASTDYIAQLRAALGSAPLTGNFWQGSPLEFISGQFRKGLFNGAIAETAPPYWANISAHAIGSTAWQDARYLQIARQRMNARTYDLCGLRALVEHKPTSLKDAPPRVLRQIMRQSCLQSVSEGTSPMPPIDVFMSVNDSTSQGVDVDGYRFWGSVADYGDIWTFIRANAGALDGYEKLALVHLAAHNGTFPFQDGSGAVRYQAVLARLAQLLLRDADYHWLTVGEEGGMLPQDPAPLAMSAAPLIIRVQDDSDYYTHLGVLSRGQCRQWSRAAADEAMDYSPVRSLSPWVRATARYSPTAGRVSVHLHNHRINSDGTPRPETTIVRWNRAFGTPVGSATVTRLGEAPGTVQVAPGYWQVTLREFAIVNFVAN